MNIEIILIIIAGIITVGLSINALIKSNKAETELKKSQKELVEKQDKIISLHESIGKKSDEIIHLQENLSVNSKKQIKELNKLKTPVPSSVRIFLESKLDVTPQEFNEIENDFKSSTPQKSNLLPIDFNSSSNGVKKIEVFKNISFQLRIEIENDEKDRMTIIYNSSRPLNLAGYNSSWGNNSFILALFEDSKSINFTGSLIETSSLTYNYLSPSLLDFKKSKVKISYSFSYPKRYQVGNNVEDIYIENNSINSIHINDISLTMNTMTIKVDHLKKIDPFHYEGTLTF